MHPLVPNRRAARPPFRPSLSQGCDCQTALDHVPAALLVSSPPSQSHFQYVFQHGSALQSSSTSYSRAPLRFSAASCGRTDNSDHICQKIAGEAAPSPTVIGEVSLPPQVEFNRRCPIFAFCSCRKSEARCHRTNPFLQNVLVLQCTGLFSSAGPAAVEQLPMPSSKASATGLRSAA